MGASTRKIIGNGVIEGGAGVPVVLTVVKTGTFDPVPDVRGDFMPNGTVNGFPAYIRTDGLVSITWVNFVASFYKLTIRMVPDTGEVFRGPPVAPEVFPAVCTPAYPAGGGYVTVNTV